MRLCWHTLGSKLNADDAMAEARGDVQSEGARPKRDVRTERLLNGPLLPTMFSLAWPTLVVQLGQTLVSLAEVWFLAKLGEETLAGVSVVFPVIALTTALSTGAIGGGILASIARALGRNDRHEANDLVWHAIAIALTLGLATTCVVLLFGARLFALMGSRGGALDIANHYAFVVFAGASFIWLFNALLSAVRGAGNVQLPMMIVGVGAIVIVPTSYLLIFGFGGWAGLGVTGGALALVTYYAVGSLIFIAHIFGGRGILTPAFAIPHIRFRALYDILKVGVPSALVSTSTNVTIAIVTGYVGHFSLEAVAGYGAASRLEFLLVPLSFGVGGPASILIGTNLGAGQTARAKTVTWISALLGFTIAEAVGLSVAIWPSIWLDAFVADASSISTGVTYLRTVGPFFGFFGLGFTQYCAAQGAGKMGIPLIGAAARTAIAVIGGYLAATQGSLFLSVALGMAAFGIAGFVSIARQ